MSCFSNVSPGANLVIAFTFCFIEDIAFPDIKCPKYSTLFLKNLQLDNFSLIPTSQIFQRLFVYVLGVLKV